jgi:hypothetical protein
MVADRLTPVYLDPEPARLTEYGKRWFDDRSTAVDLHWHLLADVIKLGAEEKMDQWPAIERELKLSGVPTALTGLAQYAMAKSMDNSVGKTQFTAPAVVALALLTVAPTTASTGASVTDATYTGYVRFTTTPSTWTNAATVATPSVVTNASTITFAACTASTSTLLGLAACDSATVAAGNALWVTTLTSTVISVTQTPPTIASAAMSLSMNGS